MKRLAGAEFGNEPVYASSDDPDLSVYVAKRDDRVLTILVIISHWRRRKVYSNRRSDSNRSGASLFDPGRKAEPMGALDLSQKIIIAPQSISLLEVQE